MLRSAGGVEVKSSYRRVLGLLDRGFILVSWDGGRTAMLDWGESDVAIKAHPDHTEVTRPMFAEFLREGWVDQWPDSAYRITDAGRFALQVQA